MTEKLSKNQITRLGNALRQGSLNPRSQEATEFEFFMNSRELDLQTLMQQLKEFLPLELNVTSRIKSTSTLREKLLRAPEIQLPYVRDVIGVRIIGDFTLSGQDELVNSIINRFKGFVVKKIDRRLKHSYGYRAVHIVIRVNESLAEIQVRTELQNQWADVFEALADKWGRQIRYGLTPDFPSPRQLKLREAHILRLTELSLNDIAEYEKISSAIDLQSKEPPVMNTNVRGLSRAQIAEQMRHKILNSRLNDLSQDLETKLRDWEVQLVKELDRLATEAEKIN